MERFSSNYDIEGSLGAADPIRFIRGLWEPLSDDRTVFTMYGRNALYLGMKSISLITPKREILLPSYSCGEEIQAAIEAGFIPRFYRVNFMMEVDPKEIEVLVTEATAAVLATHYLGFPLKRIGEIAALCKKEKIYFIEDCAHCCGGSPEGTPLGSYGDISVFSLKKALGIPHGGALVANNQKISLPATAEPPSSATALDFFLFLGFRNGWIKPGFDIRKMLSDTTTEAAFGALHDKVGGYGLGLSRLAKAMIESADVKSLAIARNDNYKRYLRIFEKAKPNRIKAMFTEIDTDACPLFFPIVVDDSERKHRLLIENKICISQPFWSHWHPACDPAAYPEANELKRRLMVLPVTHRISDTQIMRLIEFVENSDS
ncbi:MAG: DegT/DnrJ/EryC1/StrS aminotransferase family protein [Candidatus Taylorbacteria bacterium]|nr:DegT/DnrJ/EryC1/StrS aminotransferase family protein [Candidatus Taylorbacteria bacterium]